MGPISPGNINDLMNLARVVEFLMVEGNVAVITEIKEQMDALTSRGAELALKEVELNALAVTAAEREEETARLLAGAIGKHEEASRKLQEATGVLETATRNATRVAQDTSALEARTASIEADFTKRDHDLTERENRVAQLLENARSMEAEYKGKLEALKNLAG